MNYALPVDGSVDRIRRLYQDPPVEWDGTTAWGVDDIEGDTVLIETALIECPDCGAKAYWARGRVACSGCGTHRRLVG